MHHRSRSQIASDQRSQLIIDSLTTRTPAERAVFPGKSFNLFEGLTFLLACSVNFVRRQFYTESQSRLVWELFLYIGGFLFSIGAFLLKVCLSVFQKTRGGCGCFWGLCGSSGGKSRENSGKIAGKFFLNRQMLQILRFEAPGKANLPGTLGPHCRDLVPTFRAGCFLKSTVPAFSSFSAFLLTVWGRAKRVEKASCGETVVQKGVSAAPPPLQVLQTLRGQRRKRLSKAPFGQLFLHTTPSPLLWRV